MALSRSCGVSSPPVQTEQLAELVARSELEMDAVRRGKFSLQGFVAYMRRKDAETAVRELDGADWGGTKLKVSFSKPVPIPQRALYGECAVADRCAC